MVPSHYSIGFNGNSTIYMSTGVCGYDKPSSRPTLLQNTTNSCATTSKSTYYSPYDLQNSISLAVASSYQPNPLQKFSFSEICKEGSILAAYIPLSMSGLEYVNNSNNIKCTPVITPQLM